MRARGRGSRPLVTDRVGGGEVGEMPSSTSEGGREEGHEAALERPGPTFGPGVRAEPWDSRPAEPGCGGQERGRWGPRRERGEEAVARTGGRGCVAGAVGRCERLWASGNRAGGRGPTAPPSPFLSCTVNAGPGIRVPRPLSDKQEEEGGGSRLQVQKEEGRLVCREISLKRAVKPASPSLPGLSINSAQEVAGPEPAFLLLISPHFCLFAMN